MFIQPVYSSGPTNQIVPQSWNVSVMISSACHPLVRHRNARRLARKGVEGSARDKQDWQLTGRQNHRPQYAKNVRRQSGACDGQAKRGTADQSCRACTRLRPREDAM